MPLLINVRHVEKDDVHLQGELPVEELDLQMEDELVHARKPLAYNVTVQKLGQQLLVQGHLQLTVECECARCLRPMEQKMDFPQWVAHLPLEGEEKVTINNDCVDLTPFIREDILLEFPQHPLCGIDCAGLPNRNDTGRGKEQPGQVLPDWSELNKLKF